MMESQGQAKADIRRLKILTEEELSDIYGLPSFDDEERGYYFTLTTEQEQAM